jgi:hypothetical protein
MITEMDEYTIAVTVKTEEFGDEASTYNLVLQAESGAMACSDAASIAMDLARRIGETVTFINCKEVR